MSYVAKITQNGELTIGGGQCRITKDAIESAIAEFNAKLPYHTILGHLHRSDCGELEHMGFSHRITGAFTTNGESFAIIEPIHTPDGQELDRMLRDSQEVIENNDLYEFSTKGFINHGDLAITGIDIIRKGEL